MQATVNSSDMQKKLIAWNPIQDTKELILLCIMESYLIFKATWNF